jgi:hypothetical protein
MSLKSDEIGERKIEKMLFQSLKIVFLQVKDFIMIL